MTNINQKEIPGTVTEKKGFVRSAWTKWEEEQYKKETEEARRTKENNAWLEDQKKANEVIEEQEPEDVGKEPWKPRARPIDKTLPSKD